jgi:aminoglycoside phosphotransferase (APT) family kinase protein
VSSATATPERSEIRELGGDAAALDPRLMATRLGGDAPCHVVDAKLEPGGGGVVLYRIGAGLVLGVADRDGELRTYPFPLDPRLPAMATVFDADAMRPALARVLGGLRSPRERVLRYRAELIRYRPGRRCTLRLDLGLSDPTRPGAVRRRELYAKLYHDAGKAAAAHAAQVMVSAAASLPDVAFARPAGFARDMNLVLQEPLSGAPLEPLVGVGDGAASAMAAAAVAAIHDLEVSGARLRPVEPAVTRMRARADAVAQIDAPLGTAMAEVAERLLRLLGRLDDWGAALCLVHGDCKPSQFLIGRSGVSILDLDHCGMADPAADVGEYLASLRALEARGPARAGARRHTAGARRRFLDAYVARRGDDGLLLRARWYEAAALLRKGYRAFQRSPRSTLAPALVTAAGRGLDALPRAGRPR